MGKLDQFFDQKSFQLESLTNAIVKLNTSRDRKFEGSNVEMFSPDSSSSLELSPPGKSLTSIAEHMTLNYCNSVKKNQNLKTTSSINRNLN